MKKQLTLMLLLCFPRVLIVAMDVDEEVPRTEGFIRLNNHQLVKVPLMVIAMLSKLEKQQDGHAHEFYVLPEAAQVSALRMQEAIFYLKEKKYIDSLATKHELLGLVHLFEKLGAQREVVAKVQALSEQLPNLDHVLSGDCLNLSDCNLKSCIGLEQWRSDEVKYLVLSNNKIRRFDVQELLGFFPKLRFLDVSHNKIKKMYTCMVAEMPPSFSLNISDNPVRSYSKSLIPALKKLRDHDNFIRLYSQQLPEKDLLFLAESLQGKSKQRRTKEIFLLGGSILLCFGGIICGTVRGVLAEEDNLSKINNILLMMGLTGGTVSSGIGIIYSSVYEAFSPKEQQPSRLFWGSLSE